MSTPTNGTPEPTGTPGPHGTSGPHGSDLPQYNAQTNQNPYATQGQQPHYGQSPSGQQPQGSGQKIKGTPPLWLGITLAVAGPLLGILLLVISVVSMAGTAQDMANAESGSTHTLEAEQSYWVMSADPTVSSGSAGSCSIYDPQTNSIEFEATETSTSASSDDGQSVTVLGTFTSADAGEYDIYCSGLASSDLYVAKANISGLVGGAVGILGGILLGGLLFLVGIVLIIVNRVTASRRRRAAGLA
ncbi:MULTISPECIES: hypothetical protein [Kocuria]|uniref:Uncharacterized protein n=1 Tax=Kocuria subflava TaxID=1736139 RepID=A0A846U3W4_9MICC|nr:MULTISPECIES: hypothetical protein [Kocuria]NKE08456.1 hypothetical protein [Kocuria subflava]